MNNFGIYKKNKGFTLIEILIVLIIIGIGIAAILSNRNTADRTQKIQDVVQGLTVLTSCVKDKYGTLRDYTGLTNTTLLGGVCVPTTMRGGAGQIQNPWSNTGVVVVATGGNDTYSITYSAIPQQECTDIGYKINPQNSQFETITINGNAINGTADVDVNCAAANAMAWTGR